MTKAVRYDEFGGIDVLRIDEVNRPVPEDRQVLVQVRAAGINPDLGYEGEGATFTQPVKRQTRHHPQHRSAQGAFRPGSLR